MLNEEKNILFLKECFDVTFYFIFKRVTPFIQWEETDRSIKTDYSDSICSLLYIVYRCSLINFIVKPRKFYLNFLG